MKIPRYVPALLTAALMQVWLAPGGRAAEEVRIAAAASFREALDAIIAGYQQSTAVKVTVIYGATGNLMRQIALSAPFDLFLAADEESPRRLAADGFTANVPEVLVSGRLSLVWSLQSAIAPGNDFAGLRAAVASGTIRRFAIANPEIAPYGRAAKEALDKLGLLPALQNRFAFAENIGQTAQYVATGAAEAGIVARSLAVVEPLRSQVGSLDIPADFHAPINQAFVILKRAGAEAGKFALHLKSAQAYAIFDRHGFARP